ncbi:helix-turn-helix transcriptional regulator [Endozoicomonas sp. 4G]|uniref:helix-turn-helix domain-containing protein n=1 Tax=Endozoicomonas sp. 4G TaxID=2872754 RepID=UPI002078D5F7|nr:helix-turn-helix transcriptional regulator [Endozoicomonas sp. 4G]
MVEILKHEGVPAFAVIPYAMYEKLIELAEESKDIKDYDNFWENLESGNEEFITSDVADRLLNENPLKVWREYRDLTQDALSEKSGVSASMIAQIETGRKTGSVKTLAKLSEALSLSVEDIIE